MYPEEHGADLALLWLTAFPRATTFRRIDDIDRCNLFLAEVKHSNRSDPFDGRNFHVAIWHEDLLELQRRGDIKGVSRANERRWEELKRAALPPGPLYTERSDGALQKLELPPLEDYDEEDASWPVFTANGVTVTSSGWTRAASVLSEVSSDLAILGGRNFAATSARILRYGRPGSVCRDRTQDQVVVR